MRQTLWSLPAVAVASLLVSAPIAFSAPSLASSNGRMDPPSVGFIANTGQVEGPARFYASEPRGAVYFEPASVLVDHAPTSDGQKGVVVRIDFPASKGRAVLTSGEPTDLKVSSFHGQDPGAWRSGLTTYREVRYDGIAPGADLVYRVDGNHLKYDVLLAPRASLASVRLRYRGVDRLELAEDGALILHSGASLLREEPPVLYQEVDGQRVPVAGGYRVTSNHEVGYWAGSYDHALPLVFDPGMIWSTFVGGTGADYIYAVAADGQGNLYVAGYTSSTDYPTTTGAYQRTKAAGSDAVVTKLSPDGRSVLWSTFLGGSGATEYGHGIGVDANNQVYVCGATNSPDFPVTPGAFATTKPGGTYDGFVTKLSAAGDRLLYSTYLGGNGDDYALSLALDSSGEALVAGLSGSTIFPTTPGVVKPSRAGVFPDASDGFVAKVNTTGSALAFCTFLGADGGSDAAYGIACDPSGTPTIVGFTASPTFPTTTGALDRTFACCREGFVTRLNNTGSGYLFSTFLGKTVEDAKDIELYAVALDGTGNVFVAGRTNSTSYPTKNPFQPSSGGGTYDAVVAKLASNGASLIYSSYLGGSGDDEAYAIALNNMGYAAVTGFSDSGNFPTTAGAYDTSPNGGADGFVTSMNSAGSRLYSSVLGSSGVDYGLALTVLTDGSLALAGITNGSTFPTTSGAYDVTMNSPGAYDGYVCRFDAGLSSTAAVQAPALTPGLTVENPYPNPFPGQSAIRVSLDRDGPLTVRVFDPQGRVVRTLANGSASMGSHSLVWDGRDDRGRPVATGLYLFQVSAAGYRTTRPALLIK